MAEIKANKKDSDKIIELLNQAARNYEAIASEIRRVLDRGAVSIESLEAIYGLEEQAQASEDLVSVEDFISVPDQIVYFDFRC